MPTVIWDVCSTGQGPIPGDQARIWADKYSTVHDCAGTKQHTQPPIAWPPVRAWAQGCQQRFEILVSLSAPTHFCLCTAAQICKWLSSECRALDQLQCIPFCSPPLPALTLPFCSFFLCSSLPPPPPLIAVFYLVLAALLLAYAPAEGLNWWGDFSWAPSG